MCVLQHNPASAATCHGTCQLVHLPASDCSRCQKDQAHTSGRIACSVYPLHSPQHTHAGIHTRTLGDLFLPRFNPRQAGRAPCLCPREGWLLLLSREGAVAAASAGRANATAAGHSSPGTTHRGSSGRHTTNTQGWQHMSGREEATPTPSGCWDMITSSGRELPVKTAFSLAGGGVWACAHPPATRNHHLQHRSTSLHIPLYHATHTCRVRTC